jgi:hypothetical protein
MTYVERVSGEDDANEDESDDTSDGDEIERCVPHVHSQVDDEASDEGDVPNPAGEQQRAEA